MNKLSYERWCLCAVFLMHGAIFSSWAARIPQIQQRLAMSNGDFGVALFCFAMGSFIAMPLAGVLGARVGSSALTRFTSIGMCLCLLALGYSASPFWLSFSLFVFGTMLGGMDIAMNGHAVVLERQFGKTIMSTFHAMFSLGGMLGAAIAAFVASRGVMPELNFVGFCAVGVPVLLLTGSALKEPGKTMGVEQKSALPEASEKKPLVPLPSRRTLGLAILCFCSFIGEGAIGDWSAIYMTKDLVAPPAVAALGYTAYSLSMGICRLAGDFVMRKFGADRVLLLGGLLAAAGMAMSLFVPSAAACILAYAICGIGFSAVVPAIFSSAGRESEGSATAAIAGVATAGYLGFVVAPPFIGWLADHITLRYSLLSVVLLCLLIAILSPCAQTKQKEISLEAV